MIDLNKAIANNRFTVLDVHNELHNLASNFAATGNDYVASQLREMARVLAGSASALDKAFFAEVNRVVQADQKALRDTLLAVSGVRL